MLRQETRHNIQIEGRTNFKLGDKHSAEEGQSSRSSSTFSSSAYSIGGLIN